MSPREIDIPFGPDKTGGIGYGALPAELPPFASYDFDDETVDEPARMQLAQTRPVRAQDIPLITPESVSPRINAASRGQYASSGVGAAQSAEYMQEDLESAWDLEPMELEEQQGQVPVSHDVQTSFAALRDSVAQSRELKAREKELEEFREHLEREHEDLADREDILAHYDVLVSEQDDILEHHARTRDNSKAELARVMDDRERVAHELDEMRARNDEDLEPLQSELGRARAVAERVKNDERSRKSELSAAEAEVRRAGSGQDAVMAQARYDSVKLAYDKAASVSGRVQAKLDEAQRAYDDAMTEVEQMEEPLKHTLDDLAQREEDLKELIAHLGDELSAARKRRQYCESVHLYPEETTKLRKAVEADEQELHEMELDCDELRSLFEHNKSQARKAKVTLAAAAVIIVAFVIFLLFLFMRS